MSGEERKEYNCYNKRRSRIVESDTKKEDLKQQVTKEKFKRRFARFRHKRTEDLQDSEEEEDFLKRYLKWDNTDVKKYPFKLSLNEERAIERLLAETNDGETSTNSEEGDELYWMKHEDDDNERDGVLVFDKVSPGE